MTEHGTAITVVRGHDAPQQQQQRHVPQAQQPYRRLNPELLLQQQQRLGHDTRDDAAHNHTGSPISSDPNSSSRLTTPALPHQQQQQARPQHSRSTPLSSPQQLRHSPIVVRASPAPTGDELLPHGGGGVPPPPPGDHAAAPNPRRNAPATLERPPTTLSSTSQVAARAAPRRGAGVPPTTPPMSTVETFDTPIADEDPVTANALRRRAGRVASRESGSDSGSDGGDEEEAGEEDEDGGDGAYDEEEEESAADSRSETSSRGSN